MAIQRGSKRGIRPLAVTLLVLLVHGISFSQVTDGGYDLLLQNILAHQVKEISVRRAKAWRGALWLDARSREEYHVSHVKDAVWVGYRSFDLSVLHDIPKDTRIIVYCSVGWRSEKIAVQIRDAGFKRVVNLYGGIFEWVNQGLPVYRDDEEIKEVHAFSFIWGVWLKNGIKVYNYEAHIE